jgi:hypothetical protein
LPIENVKQLSETVPDELSLRTDRSTDYDSSIIHFPVRIAVGFFRLRNVKQLSEAPGMNWEPTTQLTLPLVVTVAVVPVASV